MKVKKGVGVSEGYAIAPVKILDDDTISIPQRYIKRENVENEIILFEKACKSVVQDLNKKVKKFPAILKEESISIVSSYTKILFDQSFIMEVKELIKVNFYSAPYAIFKVLKKYINILENSQDEFFRSRASDLIGLRNLVIKKITAQEDKNKTSSKEKYIIVAKEFNLASTVNTLIKNLAGIITEKGTKTSHAAILAKEFGIPAVTALDNITQELVDREIIIVDGFSGNIIINPTEDVIKKYQTLLNIYQEEKKRLIEVAKTMPAVTMDCKEIKVYANIEFPDEIQYAINVGADGVGLFRTEFSLHISDNKLPTFEELYQQYRGIVEQCPDMDIVFRLFDIGGDKLYPHLSKDYTNPFLGVRGIRVYNLVPQLFIDQIKAILMLPLKKIKIMVPMVSNLDEVLLIKNICADILNEVYKYKSSDNFKFALGIMLEVPSAILSIEQIGKEVDFFSIGTNDLIQYTLAIDRTNNDVAYLYQPLHRSILKLLQISIEYCEKNNKDLSVCGEIASDPIYSVLLIGMGVKILSVAPSAIPNLKKTICNIRFDEVKKIIEQIWQYENPQDAYKYLEDKLNLSTAKLGGV